MIKSIIIHILLFSHRVRFDSIFVCCCSSYLKASVFALQWRHDVRDGVSNQPRYCLLNSLFNRRSKKPSKLRVTDLCAGNSPITSELSAQMASNAKKIEDVIMVGKWVRLLSFNWLQNFTLLIFQPWKEAKLNVLYRFLVNPFNTQGVNMAEKGYCERDLITDDKLLLCLVREHTVFWIRFIPNDTSKSFIFDVRVEIS